MKNYSQETFCLKIDKKAHFSKIQIVQKIDYVKKKSWKLNEWDIFGHFQTLRWRQLCCVLGKIFFPNLQAFIVQKSAKLLFSLIFIVLTPENLLGLKPVVKGQSLLYWHYNDLWGTTASPYKIRNQKTNAEPLVLYIEPIMQLSSSTLKNWFGENKDVFLRSVVFIQSVVKVNTRSNEGL